MNNPKVSLTIWWEHVAHQIRIQGFCSLIDPQLADSYWEKRVHDAQVVSYIFDQSQEIEHSKPCNKNLRRDDKKHKFSQYPQLLRPNDLNVKFP